MTQILVRCSLCILLLSLHLKLMCFFFKKKKLYEICNKLLLNFNIIVILKVIVIFAGHEKSNGGDPYNAFKMVKLSKNFTPKKCGQNFPPKCNNY
jgi:hypothetical protein